jgi:CheY-like chemotaxis protein
MLSAATMSDDLQSTLGGHHRRLNTLLDDLWRAFECGEQVASSQLWSAFERELAAHFALEEKQIFPALTRIIPSEVTSLQYEHDELRRHSAQLGVGVELDLVRSELVAQLIAQLRAHALREEALLYRCVDTWLRERACGSSSEQHDANGGAGMSAGSDEHALSSRPRGTSQRVVVYVEDNAANVALVRDLLADFDQVELLTASSAEIGVELVRERRPDVVLMDIHLPGMSGIEAAKLLQQWPETRAIPVIALSAAATRSDPVGVTQAGFYCYLTKPVNVELLVQVLEALLNRPRLPHAS